MQSASVRRSALALLAAVAAAISLPGVAQGAPHRADGLVTDWRGDPTMLSGQTRISRGELIHDDWLYDDYGANLNGGPDRPAFRAALAPTRGDYRYPTNANRYGHNAADLRQLRVAADGSGLHVVAFLQTMKDRDAPIVTLAIDSGRARDEGLWPDGAGLDAPGADHFVTFSGSFATVTDSRGHRQRLRRPGVSMAENALEIDIPWRSLPATRGRTVTLYVAAGLLDPQTNGYRQVPAGNPTASAPGGGAPGATAVFDVGFDPDEIFSRAIGSHWGEERQSAALAQRDTSELGHQVHLSELEAQITEPYTPMPGRFYNRIFRSEQSYGEGIELKNPTGSNAGGSPEPQFLSPHQPYGLYLPDDYVPGPPAPLLINGHSLDVNHNEYQSVSPNLFNQLGDERSSIVFTPLARGMDTWYIDAGFVDVLEAWADVKAHYTVDDERTHITGYSMGGYMTYRMGLLMPDRFATATPYVGPPTYQLWVPPNEPQPPGDYQVAGNTNLIVYNGLNLPFEMNNGGVDELVPAAGPQEQAQTFREFGNPHLFYFYPTLDHFALILADEWGHTRDWMDRFPRRKLDVTEVRFVRYPSMDLPQHGLRFDGAYWVDGMVVRTPGDSCAPGDASCEAASGLVEGYTTGFDKSRNPLVEQVQFTYPGPPAPADVRGTERTYGGTASLSNYLDVRTSNLRAVTLDMPGAGIDTTQDIRMRLAAGGGAFTLTLQGDFGPGTQATIEQLFPCCPESEVPVQHTAGGIVLELQVDGQYNLRIRP
jgi:dienelactone hydrolase